MTPLKLPVPLSYLLAGTLALPLFMGWSSPATGTPAVTYPAPRLFKMGTSSASVGALKVVQLTDAEVAALGLPPQGVFSANSTASQGAFAHPAFQRTWARTDSPVASGQEKRSWYWGPQPNSGGLQEDYAEGQGGKRLVQYFDKSRMEINNPTADPNNPFFVTNGLLTVELISGKMQTGNSRYADRWPADIPLASDPDDANAPTYLSMQGVSNTTLGDRPATSRTGQAATATISRNGSVGNDPTKAQYPDVNFVYFEEATKHNIPKAIWDFLNQSGNVFNPQTGRSAPARLSDPWFYATGLPISEPYWARVKIAGQQQDVLIQAFERRVVTYVPNGVPGFKVQMGNIGQHYYDWRYKDAGRPPGDPGQPTPRPTTPPGQPTPPPPPAGDPCAGIPASINATVRPNCGQGGTIFEYEGRNFSPGENVGIYVTAPDQSVFGAEFQAVADGSGVVGGIGLDTFPGIPTGIWAFTGEGVSSRNRAIGYFKIYDPSENATPTPGGGGGGSASCDDVPPSQNMTITPSNCARAGTRFIFTGRGFQPGEQVGVYVTDPSQAVFGAPFQIEADSAGVAGSVSFTTQSNFPLGVWAMTMEGTTSRAVAIGYFKLTPP
jgi:hypothetical protein